MSKCPYCETEMGHGGHVFMLSKKRQRLFDLVAKSGKDGVSKEDLMAKVGIKNVTTLRTTIHQTNHHIGPLCIKQKSGIYRLMRETPGWPRPRKD